jgi:ADP-ribosylglycohydrolase
VPSRKKHIGWIEKNKMDGWMRSKKETARALLQAKIHRKIKNRKNKSEISNRKIKSGNEKDDHVPRSFFSLSYNIDTQSKKKEPQKKI